MQSLPMIEILNRQRKYPINKRRIMGLLKRLSEHYGHQDSEVTLVFVNNRTMAELNNKYLKKNEPTDVLSFPLGEKGPDGIHHLGDIVISVPKAYDQSLARNHGLEREIEFLTCHGFLHLLGFEHAKGLEEEEQKITKLFLSH